MTTASATLPTEPLAIRVTLEGRATVARVQHFSVDADGRLIRQRRPARRRFPRYSVTEKGRAAAAYLKALDTYVAECRTCYDENFEPTSAYYDAAPAIARVTALETAANAYRDLGGFICEDCNQLEGCLCPNV